MSMWTWFNEGGILMWVLLCLSLMSWFVIGDRFLVLLREIRGASRIFEALPHILDGDLPAWMKKGDGAYTLSLALVENDHLETEDIANVAKSKMIEEITQLERGLTLLEVVATIAPLLGLLGTVLGMVEVFGVISKVGLGDPHVLSGGISKALNTTVFGLIVAVPSYVGFSFYGRRIDRITRSFESFIALYLSEKNHVDNRNKKA